MGEITRNPKKASRKKYDLIIIGGGIYGAMLCLEAVRRGLCPVILEKDDFGSHTSFNSLRIIHGGLRYLQSLDIHRFYESVRERSWFLRTFPELVKPLPCLMPLYGKGLRRPLILRAALLANDLLSRGRNKKIRDDRHILEGYVIDAGKTADLFPLVRKSGLQGGAVWYDACMPDSQRVLMEVLRWACLSGGVALNYMRADELIIKNGKARGVKAFDRENSRSYYFESDFVINGAGPWCRSLAKAFHRDEPKLFKPSLAWNILFDREAVSDCALAVSSEKKGSHTYFIVPWKGRIFAGTGHLSRAGSNTDNPEPNEKHIKTMLDDINRAIPGLNLSENDIYHVFSGFLPVKKAGTTILSDREVIIDHGKKGGPKGLWSISGVKFTTSRLVAEKALNRIFPEKKIKDSPESGFKPDLKIRDVCDFNLSSPSAYPEFADKLKKIMENEAVCHPDDLIFRRTSLWADPAIKDKILPLVKI